MHVGQTWCTAGLSTDSQLQQGGRPRNNSDWETILIPSMMFTCSGKIQSLKFAGQLNTNNFMNSSPTRLQVWRRNESAIQETFFRLEDQIALRSTICRTIGMSGSNVFKCQLDGQSLVSVQPNDIIGIALPPSGSRRFDLYFTQNTSQRTMLHIFSLPRNIKSVILNESTVETDEIPLISFSVKKPKGGKL